MENIKSYLLKTLDIKITLKSWSKSNDLPIYLQNSFDFFKTKILDLPCLLIIAKNESEISPAVIKKHIRKIQEKCDCEIVYVQDGISAYNRHRLINHKVSFIVPDNQMYLPVLGIDLREHLHKIRLDRKRLRPSAQAVIIYALLNKSDDRYTPKILSEILSYSTMALTRAFDEIESNNIGTTIQDGRERILLLPDNRKELWDKANIYMRSPVKKLIRIKKIPDNWELLQSGITALSHYSMISAPSYDMYAIDGRTMRQHLTNDKIVQIPSNETIGHELEIWHYDPNLFSNKKFVDPFSLYLSLMDNDDERVQLALKEMLEQIEW